MFMRVWSRSAFQPILNNIKLHQAIRVGMAGLRHNQRHKPRLPFPFSPGIHLGVLANGLTSKDLVRLTLSSKDPHGTHSGPPPASWPSLRRPFTRKLSVFGAKGNPPSCGLGGESVELVRCPQLNAPEDWPHDKSIT